MKYSEAFKNKYRKLINSVTGFDDLSWYRKRHIPKILKNKERYKKIADELGIPLAIIPLIETKEMGSSVGKFDRYIGNGQPLNKKTTIVPKNRGPFATWEDGVRDAIKYDGLDRVKEWTEERMLFELESYNGWGYYNRGKNSAYLWAKSLPHGRGTGKFVRDGVYDPKAIPKNIGVWACYKLLIEADSDFKIGGVVSPIQKPENPELSPWAALWGLLLELFDYIKKNYEPKAKDGVEPLPIEETKPKMYRNKAILIAASHEVGVKEVRGKSGSNPTVENYLDHGYSKSNKSTSLRDDNPWCAGFIAFILEANKLIPMGSTNSLLARSYERWGVSVLNDPQPGDIATMWRKSKAAGTGHVTFFLGWHKKGKSFYGLGGNQNDEVNISIYSVEKLTGFRRSSKSIKLGTSERKELADLAAKIRSGAKIEVGGKVS